MSTAPQLPPLSRERTATAIIHMLLLWMAGNSLRLTVLAVPPLIPAIHHSLHLDESAIGALSALPVLLLAAAAVPGSLLITRIGARRALILGLFTVAVSGALRGVGSSTPILFAMTLVMGLGIAISQPALPSLVRQWFPNRSALATAIYSNGFLIGELVAAALTVPLILSLVGGRWPWALAAWSLPVLATGLAIARATVHTPREPGAPRGRWWPDWSDPLTWRLGLILGGASTSYWGANAFIPDYLRSVHQGGLITAALTMLNLCQLPASLIVGLVPHHVVGRRWPIVAVGVTTIAGSLALSAGGIWVVPLAGILGFSSALIFVLALALPPLVAPAHDVHRLSAAMFTISYTCPFIGAILGGAAWDISGVAAIAFAPIVLSGAAMASIAVGLRVPSSS